ncbi:energy-coupling factor transporter transmembrane component T family protein [Klebsiella variicola]|uniref:hypothetical protein n=1 Tax=Klebsiella variicola TaxID=244366 RepID=UPI002B0609E9|nr:hypothetical protein [Klebsiella variicola]
MQIQNRINQQQEKVNSLYEKYCEDLHEYAKTKNLDNADKSMKQLCNYLEQCCATNNSDEDMRKTSWNQWLAESCHDVLELLVEHYQRYRTYVDDQSISPSKTAYSGMQRMAKAYCGKEKSNNLRALLHDNNLPTFGFDTKEKVDPVKIALTVGVILVAIIIFLSAYFISDRVQLPLIIGLCFSALVFISCLFIKKLSGMQYFVLRTLFSISIPGLLISFPGFIELTFNKYGFGISAVGLFAIFYIIYKLNPAKLSELDK